MVKFETLDNAPGYKKVATAIEAGILAGHLKEGDLLPTETDLAEQLGLHRSTVREGIRSLENAGLVQRAGAKRLRITVPDPMTLARANTRAIGLSQVTFNELWEIQMQLEPFGARLAAERIDAGLVDKIMTNVAELEAQLEDDEAVIRNDITFHRLVAEAARNTILSVALAPVSVLLFSATVPLYQKVQPARHRLLAAHRAIAEAIAAGNATVAEEWMARHIRDFRRGYSAGGLAMGDVIKLDPRSLDLFGD